MPRHPPNALKTLDHSHCQYPSCLAKQDNIAFSLTRPTALAGWRCAGAARHGRRPSGLHGSFPCSASSVAIDQYDKKDQLLEINPVALRLSGQSSARAFDEHPLRHFPAFMAKGRRISPRRHKPLNIRNNPNLSSLHNFIQNRQPSGTNPTSCKLASSNDVFAPSICQNLWWRRTGSNRRPPACKAGALPAELRPRGSGHTTRRHRVGSG